MKCKKHRQLKCPLCFGRGEPVQSSSIGVIGWWPSPTPRKSWAWILFYYTVGLGAREGHQPEDYIHRVGVPVSFDGLD